jgi:hypothetical protein
MVRRRRFPVDAARRDFSNDAFERFYFLCHNVSLRGAVPLIGLHIGIEFPVAKLIGICLEIGRGAGFDDDDLVALFQQPWRALLGFDWFYKFLELGPFQSGARLQIDAGDVDDRLRFGDRPFEFGDLLQTRLVKARQPFLARRVDDKLLIRKEPRQRRLCVPKTLSGLMR